LTPEVFIGLIVGAMLLYWFSVMVMKSVGSATLKMVEEVCRQFNTIPGLMKGTVKLDYAICVKISTNTSIIEMILPGALEFSLEDKGTLNGENCYKFNLGRGFWHMETNIWEDYW